MHRESDTDHQKPSPNRPERPKESGRQRSKPRERLCKSGASVQKSPKNSDTEPRSKLEIPERLPSAPPTPRLRPRGLSHPTRVNEGALTPDLTFGKRREINNKRWRNPKALSLQHKAPNRASKGKHQRGYTVCLNHAKPLHPGNRPKIYYIYQAHPKSSRPDPEEGNGGA